MNRYIKNTKLATALAAALMISAPIVFVPAASFAADNNYSDARSHDRNTNTHNDKNNRDTVRHDNRRYDNNKRDRTRHNNARYDHRKYDNARHVDGKKYRVNHRRYDAMRDRNHRPALRHERRGYAPHRGWRYHQGSWNWERNHWVWITGVWLNR